MVCTYRVRNDIMLDEERQAHTVYGIARKTVQGAERSHSQFAVNTVSHACRMQFIPRFSCAGQPVFQQRLIHTAGCPVFFQDPQPVQIILMALVLFHREFQQNASFGQHRRAADHVAAQQHFVGDPLRDRKDLLLFRCLIVNQLPARTAEHITGLCKGFFLLFRG